MLKIINTTFLFCTFVFAHPHIFVDNIIDVDIREDKKAEVSIKWVLDEMTSMTLIMDYDRDGSRNFSEAEQQTLRKDAFDHLKDINYMTLVDCNGQPKKIETINHFNASIQKDRVVYQFAFDLACIKPGENIIKIGCADEENYMSLVITENRVDSKSPAIKIKESEIIMEDFGLSVADVLKISAVSE